MTATVNEGIRIAKMASLLEREKIYAEAYHYWMDSLVYYPCDKKNREWRINRALYCRQCANRFTVLNERYPTIKLS
ncbi:ANR family transcriptional regulator [Klebsiella aerogenes]